MTLFSIILAILITVALVCIATLMVVPATEIDGRDLAVIFGILLPALIGAGALVFSWDNILVMRADRFMLTRDAAYACADRGPSSCKKSILEWQKDSVWYADRVSDILKNIKETK